VLTQKTRNINSTVVFLNRESTQLTIHTHANEKIIRGSQVYGVKHKQKLMWEAALVILECFGLLLGIYDLLLALIQYRLFGVISCGFWLGPLAVPCVVFFSISLFTQFILIFDCSAQTKHQTELPSGSTPRPAMTENGTPSTYGATEARTGTATLLLPSDSKDSNEAAIASEERPEANQDTKQPKDSSATIGCCLRWCCPVSEDVLSRMKRDPDNRDDDTSDSDEDDYDDGFDIDDDDDDTPEEPSPTTVTNSSSSSSSNGKRTAASTPPPDKGPAVSVSPVLSSPHPNPVETAPGIASPSSPPSTLPSKGSDPEVHTASAATSTFPSEDKGSPRPISGASAPSLSITPTEINLPSLTVEQFQPQASASGRSSHFGRTRVADKKCLRNHHDRLIRESPEHNINDCVADQLHHHGIKFQCQSSEWFTHRRRREKASVQVGRVIDKEIRRNPERYLPHIFDRYNRLQAASNVYGVKIEVYDAGTEQVYMPNEDKPKKKKADPPVIHLAKLSSATPIIVSYGSVMTTDGWEKTLKRRWLVWHAWRGRLCAALFAWPLFIFSFFYHLQWVALGWFSHYFHNPVVAADNVYYCAWYSVGVATGVFSTHLSGYCWHLIESAFLHQFINFHLQ
jgi:hypothetical protein